MRCFVFVTASLFLVLPNPGLAAPVGSSHLQKFVRHDLEAYPGAPSPPAAVAAFGGTVWAADSSRWEAVLDSCWTFDSGVGSFLLADDGGGTALIPAFYQGAIDPNKAPGLHGAMEGWTGLDNTYRDTPYFRRLSSNDPAWTPSGGGPAHPCVGAAAGLGGDWSLWAGVFPDEASALCFTTGQGYGNNWSVCIGHAFVASGGIATLTYSYVNETEPGFDFTYVVVDTTGEGNDVVVAVHEGSSSGTAHVGLRAGYELPLIPGPITIKFCVVTDGAYSDEDGLFPTVCGAFAVDDISISGAGISHSADFETGNDGWELLPAPPGRGGEWSDIVSLGDLPPPLTACPCDLADSVLVLYDPEGGMSPHNPYQDNLVVSPWIDLRRAGLVGYPGKYLEFSGYFELPLLDYVFVQSAAQGYPSVCPVTGKLRLSPLEGDGFVRYFGSGPVCTQPGLGRARVELGSVLEQGVEQVRVALGVVSYCRFLPACTGVSNTTPWFDNVKLGLYGDPGVPILAVRPIDLPQDAFPADGSHQIGSPARIDANTVKGALTAEPGSSLGDTLVVRGAFGVPSEVFVQLKVLPGPRVNQSKLAALQARLSVPHDLTPATQDGWYMARLDTAEQGGVPDPHGWMTTFHEEDPGFVGSDTDPDPGDPGHLWNDILSDDLFTPATSVHLFYKARHVGSTSWTTFPDTAGLYLEEAPDSPNSLSPGGAGAFIEWTCFPASMAVDSTWNCVLYVDHVSGGGAQPFLQAALLGVMGTGPYNAEGTAWDRFDVEAPSSGQGSFGKPLGSGYGVSVDEASVYKVILWNSGNLDAVALTKEDADILIPWFSRTDFCQRGYALYLSGNGLASSMTDEAASEPSARQLLEDICGVLRTCPSFRETGCPGGAGPSGMDCVQLDPVTGSQVADIPPRSVVHLAQGNACPPERNFDVLSVNPSPTFGMAVGDESYDDGAAKSAEFASLTNDVNDAGIIYRTVVDGVSVHYRRDDPSGCVLATTSPPPAVEERLAEVLGWFGFAPNANACDDPLCGGGVPTPSVRTALAPFTPNPLAAGATGRVRFSVAARTQVSLRIFDVTGRLVKTLYEGVADVGDHEAHWEGTDGAGRTVSSGIYFLRMEAGGERFAGKVVVLRR